MATDATGTPTTNYGFPTLNTSVDAPSGLGINAMMTDIDTKLKTQLDAVNTTVAAKPGIGIVIAMGG